MKKVILLVTFVLSFLIIPAANAVVFQYKNSEVDFVVGNTRASGTMVGIKLSCDFDKQFDDVDNQGNPYIAGSFFCNNNRYILMVKFVQRNSMVSLGLFENLSKRMISQQNFDLSEIKEVSSF